MPPVDVIEATCQGWPDLLTIVSVATARRVTDVQDLHR
jgi:hypothetical protein